MKTKLINFFASSVMDNVNNILTAVILIGAIFTGFVLEFVIKPLI